MSGPAAWITDESILRLQRGGNESRNTVPVHKNKSCVAKTPMYFERMTYIPPECGFLDAPIEMNRSESTAYMHGWNACRTAIGKATGETK